jgi:hypothetical protein
MFIGAIARRVARFQVATQLGRLVKRAIEIFLGKLALDLTAEYVACFKTAVLLFKVNMGDLKLFRG